jgi:hypothetical protein
MEVKGNNMNFVEQTMDLLITKYIKPLVSYEGISQCSPPRSTSFQVLER